MKQTAKKIKKLEALFRLTEEKTVGKKRALTDEQVSELTAIMDYIKSEAPLPESLIEWCAQLGLMYGVPFNNLIADERLLSNKNQVKGQSQNHPINSIRFFYIDMKWVDAMIDGALSIGTHNSKDFKLQQAVHKAFRPHIESEMLSMRQKIKGKANVENALPEKMGTLGGFILRSPLVLQWPGIEIIGFKEKVPLDFKKQQLFINDSDNFMEVLRMERLAADTMLMIFKGIPKCIFIKEPAEGVYSGFKYVKNQNQYKLALRKLKGKDEIGIPILMNNGSTDFYPLKTNENKDNDFRTKGALWKRNRRVLNIKQLKKSLEKALEKPPNAQLSPRDMAVLFVNSPRYFFHQGN